MTLRAIRFLKTPVALRPLLAVLPALALLVPAAALAGQSRFEHSDHDHADEHAHDHDHGKKKGAQHAGKAHVHGTGQLQLVVAGQQLTLSLEIPAMSLVGFEEAPRSAAEMQKLQDTLKSLEDASRWVTINPQAQCSLQQASADSPYKNAQPGGATRSHAHSDIALFYSFNCSAADQLRSLDLGLFKGFKALTEINAQWSLSGRQGGKTLTPASSVLPLAQ
jgi:hypothetical protein